MKIYEKVSKFFKKLKLACIFELSFLEIVTDTEQQCLPSECHNISRFLWIYLTISTEELNSSPLVVTRFSIFSVSKLVTAATDRTLTPGPRRPVDRSPCVRTVQTYTRRYLHCAVQLPALYNCTPPPHTSFLFVVWWDAGGRCFRIYH